MARHSLDSVPRLKIVRETIPDALEDAINRALAKVPADRYQTAAQFAEALVAASTGRVSPVTGASRPGGGRLSWRKPVPVLVGFTLLIALAWILFGRSGTARPTAAGSGLDPRRVAVLYFRDLSPDSSLGYLAEGLTNGLIAELTPVRPLDVVSRQGVARYRGADISRDSIARALAAGSLIEGSVEPVADKVRVTVRLVDGASGVDVERASFVLPRAEALSVRDSAVGEVARLLRPVLGKEVELRERRAGTTSVESWVLVQRAEQARKNADAATGRDSAAALAQLARGDTLLAAAERADPDWSEPPMLRGWLAFDATRSLAGRDARIASLQRGLEHAERALRLHAGDTRALELRGTLRYGLWRLEASPAGAARDEQARLARQDLDAAVRADPTLASAHWTLSLLLHYQKDIVSSVLAARNAYQADAYLRQADAILDRLFHSSYNIMQFAEARRWCAEGARRFPRDFRFTDCALRMLSTPDATPDVERAWRLAARIDSLLPEARREFLRRRTQMLVAAAINRAGLTDSADHMLIRARATPDIDPTMDLAGYEAIVRTMMGQREAAIALLKRYVAANPGHSFEVGGDIHWWWRDLRNDPEFARVLALTR
jgi:serine/threonine-protein kinase